MAKWEDTPEARAEEIYAEYRRRREEGGQVTLEELCEEYPDLAKELRKLSEVRAALSGIFFGGRVDGLEHVAREGFPRQVRPGEHLGEFELVRLVGHGGMGQVWEAKQLSLGGRKVALKVLRPERVDARSVAYFEREARAGARLNHPGIVTVYAFGKAEHVAWIVMEFVEGAWTLRDFLDEMTEADHRPRNYDREIARFVAEVAEALQSAHDAGVIHRDLKPQNILVTTENRPKVTDFGLARITDESALSQTGDFAGTYYYMSPEQVAAKRAGIDHRTDIFSLGVVLYELLVLRRPFVGETSHDVAHQILAKEAPRIEAVRKDTPRDLAAICRKCMEKDRDLRYESSGALAAELRRFLRGEPILTRPVAWPKRLIRAGFRDKRVAGGVALALAAAAVGYFVARAAIRSPAQSEPEVLLKQVSLASEALLAGETAEAARELELVPGDERDWFWDWVRYEVDSSEWVAHVAERGSIIRLELGPPGTEFDTSENALRGISLWDALSGEQVDVAVRGAETEPNLGPMLAVEEQVRRGGGDNDLSWRAIRNLPVANETGWWHGELWNLIARSDLDLEHRLRSLLRTADDVVVLPGRNALVVAKYGSVTIQPLDTPHGGGSLDGVYGWKLAASPDARYLAVARTPSGSGGYVYVREMAEPEVEVAVLEADTLAVSCLAFSPDGRLLIGGTLDGEVLVWETTNWSLRERRHGHASRVTDVLVLEDSSSAISAASDGTLRSWNLDEFEWVLLDGELVGRAVVLSSGELVFAGLDGVYLVESGGRGAWRRYAFDEVPYGLDRWGDDRLILGTWQGSVAELNMRTGRLESYDVDQKALYDLVAAPVHGTCFAITSDGRVLELEADPWAMVDSRSMGASAIAIDDECDRVALGTRQGALYLLDTKDALANARLVRDESKRAVVSVTFDGTGSKVAYATEDGAVRTFMVHDKENLSTIRARERIGTLAFSPDGSLIAAGHDDGGVAIWDCASGRLAWESRSAHSERVVSLCFDPAGGWLLSASEDGAVRFWPSSSRER